MNKSVSNVENEKLAKIVKKLVSEIYGMEFLGESFLINEDTPSFVEGFTYNELFRIVDKFSRIIYKRELELVDDNRYIRFFSSGPVAPYHKNSFGVLWLKDDRLVDMIKNNFSITRDDAFKVMRFYFHKKYNFNIKKAEFPPYVFPGNIDYDLIDDPKMGIKDDN